MNEREERAYTLFTGGLLVFVFGVIAGAFLFKAGAYAPVDDDLREIQRQRDAWELYTERGELR